MRSLTRAMDTILNLLTSLDIPFTHYTHPAVFTCEESKKLCPPMTGAHTKQLLMKGKNKEVYVLAIVMHDKRVDTHALAKNFGVKSFSFVSPEVLMKLLHVTPGSVTPFGLLFDTEKIINVVMDEDAWNIGTFLFHPLINTATLGVARDDFMKFLTHTRHSLNVRKIPQK